MTVRGRIERREGGQQEWGLILVECCVHNERRHKAAQKWLRKSIMKKKDKQRSGVQSRVVGRGAELIRVTEEGGRRSLVKDPPRDSSRRFWNNRPPAVPERGDLLCSRTPRSSTADPAAWWSDRVRCPKVQVMR